MFANYGEHLTRFHQATFELAKFFGEQFHLFEEELVFVLSAAENILGASLYREFCQRKAALEKARFYFFKFFAHLLVLEHSMS